MLEPGLNFALWAVKQGFEGRTDAGDDVRCGCGPLVGCKRRRCRTPSHRTRTNTRCHRVAHIVTQRCAYNNKPITREERGQYLSQSGPARLGSPAALLALLAQPANAAMVPDSTSPWPPHRRGLPSSPYTATFSSAPAIRIINGDKATWERWILHVIPTHRTLDRHNDIVAALDNNRDATEPARQQSWNYKHTQYTPVQPTRGRARLRSPPGPWAAQQGTGQMHPQQEVAWQQRPTALPPQRHWVSVLPWSSRSQGSGVHTPEQTQQI